MDGGRRRHSFVNTLDDRQLRVWIRALMPRRIGDRPGSGFARTTGVSRRQHTNWTISKPPSEVLTSYTDGKGTTSTGEQSEMLTRLLVAVVRRGHLSALTALLAYYFA
jgi:hypothetical protein